jgi:hypothetical protein
MTGTSSCTCKIECNRLHYSPLSLPLRKVSAANNESVSKFVGRVQVLVFVYSFALANSRVLNSRERQDRLLAVRLLLVSSSRAGDCATVLVHTGKGNLITGATRQEHLPLASNRKKERHDVTRPGCRGGNECPPRLDKSAFGTVRRSVDRN